MPSVFIRAYRYPEETGKKRKKKKNLFGQIFAIKVGFSLRLTLLLIISRCAIRGKQIFHLASPRHGTNVTATDYQTKQITIQTLHCGKCDQIEQRERGVSYRKKTKKIFNNNQRKNHI